MILFVAISLLAVAALAVGWAREIRNRHQTIEFAADWICELETRLEATNRDANEWAMRAGAVERWIADQGVAPPIVTIHREGASSSIRVECGCPEHLAQQIACDGLPRKLARA